MGSITVPALLDNVTSRYPGWKIYLSSNDNIPRALYTEVPLVFMCLGVVANTFLLYYLIAMKKYRSPVFTLITSLAISDWLTCLCSVAKIAMVFPNLTVPEIAVQPVCKITMFFFGWALNTSVHHLVLFAAMRFYQLCFPLKARVYVTSSSIRKCCIGVWVVIGLSAAPGLYYMSAESGLYNSEPEFICIFIGDVFVRGMSFLIANTIYPSVAIVLLHISKYIRILQARKNLAVQQERRKRDARAVVVVIILFYATWIPNNIYTVTRESKPGEGLFQDKLALIWFHVMTSNSVLNPLVYCLAAETVRNDMVNYLCGKEKRWRSS